MQKMSTADPLGGGAEGPGVATIKAKTSMADPLGGAGARDPRAPTINALKHQRQAPLEVPELDIWERPPSML
jgi:hypothetical protein